MRYDRPGDESQMREVAGLVGRAETALDQPHGPQLDEARGRLVNATVVWNGLARDPQDHAALDVISDLVRQAIHLEKHLQIEAAEFEQLLNRAVDATQSAQRITNAGGPPEEAASQAGQANDLRKQIDQLTSSSCLRDILNLKAREALEAAVPQPPRRGVSLSGIVTSAQNGRQTGDEAGLAAG